MKKSFISGLVVLLPLALTYWIVSVIVTMLTTPFMGIAESILSSLGVDKLSFLFLSSKQVLTLAGTILVLLFLFFFIISIGAIGRQIFFNYIFGLGDKILQRIPLINTVYKTSQDLIQTVFTSSNKSFKQVVLVPFPSTESWVIGLVTREDTDVEGRIAVFVPTTPNPTSGFLVMFHKEQVIHLDMKVDEALRYVISCGVLPSKLQKSAPEPVAKSE